MHTLEKKFLLFFILVSIIIGAFLHFWQLKNIPVSLYYDEMDYVVTGEAIARYGTDLSGLWSPLQLLPLRTTNVTAELPAVFHAFFQSIFGYGADSARYPATFFGILSIGLCMLIAQLLFKSKKITFLVAAVLVVNPWHVHISRSGYEAMSALFFELVFIFGFMIYLDPRSKRNSKIVSVILMILGLFIGFYTYHGAKFTVFALGLSSIPLMWIYQKNKKMNIVVTSTLLILMLVLGYRTYSLSKLGVFGDRQSETIFSSSNLSTQVDFMRRESLYLPGGSLFVNKGTVLLDLAIKHYLSVFDIYRLFVNGLEGTFQFSLIVNGFFYLSTAALFALGLWYLLKKEFKKTLPLFVLFLVSPVTSVITLGYQSIFRSALTYSLLLLFAGFGLYVLLFKVIKKFPKYSLVLQSGVYCLLIGEAIIFGHRYFSQYPVLSADNQFFYEKLLSGYLVRQETPVLVVAEKYAYSYARSYISYNQLMPTLTQEERAQFTNPKNGTFKVGNITFTENCPEEISGNGVQVVESGKYEYCGYDTSEKKALGSPIDSRAYFYLINDNTCNGADLRAFIYNNKLTDFDVMHLNNKDFCEKWVKTE